MMNKDCSLYLHVPFCRKKCRYCDFLSLPEEETDKGERAAYFQALQKEAESYGQILAGRPIRTVYLGGGTPSLVNSVYISEILCKLKSLFSFSPDIEISMEMNPGTCREEALPRYREAGINRISIGCQSVHEKELRALGRIHRYEDFLRTFDAVKNAGFQNVNVDVMTGIPYETAQSAGETLEKICALAPAHLSVYSLILEPGTPLYEAYCREPEKLCLPTEEEEEGIDALTKELLKKNGYERYEISNYARPGAECLHNVRTWECRDYVGFGAGAASCLDGVRFRNTDRIRDYIADPLQSRAEEKRLSLKEQMEEFMFLGLRMLRGVRTADFAERFGAELTDIYGSRIRKYLDSSLLLLRDGRLFLSERGLDVSNRILADFIL